MSTFPSKETLSRLVFRVTDRTTIRRLLAISAAYGHEHTSTPGPDAEVQIRASLAYLIDTLVANEYHRLKGQERKQRLQRVRATAARQLASATPDGLTRSLVFDRDARVSTRLANALVDHDVETFEDIVARYTEEDLLAWKNFGQRTLRELKRILADQGLKLRARREEATHA